MDLRQLYPKPGDDVLEWWAQVIAWAKTLTVELGPGMRASQGLHGLRILVDDSEPVRTPFRVGLTGRRARISAGYLDGRVPYVLTGVGPVRLDGTGEDGITPNPWGVVPELDLKDAKPGEDGRSAIALLVRLDARGIPLDDQATPRARHVGHVADFSGRAKRERLDAEGIAIQELAVLYWRGGEPERVGQVVRHNLVMSYAPGNRDGERGRAFFSAV